MLTSILTNSTTDVSIISVCICSVLSIVYGFILALTHKYTSKYNKNFLTTITLLPLIVMCIILLVNGNLGMSVAIAGTFSLVRFRSVPGTSKEILTVFFAMAIGLAVGMGYVLFAGGITILGCLMMIIFNATHIYDKDRYEKHLCITTPEDLDYTEVFNDTLNKYTTKYSLDNVKTTNLGSMFELKYNVILKNNINEKEFIDDLRIKNGNLKIVLTHPIDSSDL